MSPPWREERAEREERGPSFAPDRAFIRVGLASQTEEPVQLPLGVAGFVSIFLWYRNRWEQTWVERTTKVHLPDPAPIHLPDPAPHLRRSGTNPNSST